MLNNNISDYAPVSLKIAELEPGEEQKYSFLVCPCEKQLFAYQALMVYYFCHLTNQRLILETKSMGKEYQIAKGALSVLKLFVDVPAYSDFSAKQNLSKSKKLSDAQAGKYFSLLYSDIKIFEIIKVFGIPSFCKIVLKKSSNEFDNDLVFGALKVTEKSPLNPSFILSNIGYRSTDFVEIANRMLHKYADTAPSLHS